MHVNTYLTQDTIDEIIACLRRGERMNALKVYKYATGCTLQEAKQEISDRVGNKCSGSTLYGLPEINPDDIAALASRLAERLTPTPIEIPSVMLRTQIIKRLADIDAERALLMEALVRRIDVDVENAYYEGMHDERRHPEGD